MPKPASLPRWADVGGEIVEPSSGKKDTGWLDSEMPPHSYFNWWQNLVYQWTVYLDALTTEALTWTAAHVFQKGITITQSTANGTAVTATGNGTGRGGTFVGGATDGLALHATGGGTNGRAGQFHGKGTGSGIYADAEINAYAIEAYSTANISGGPTVYFEKTTGTGPTLKVISGDDEAQAILAETVSAGVGSVAVKALAKDTGHVAVRAEGHSAGSGSPVHAIAGHSSQSAVLADGSSAAGSTGLKALCNTGKAVHGVNSGATGYAGYFDNTGGSSDPALYAHTNGNQVALYVESEAAIAVGIALNNPSNTVDPALSVYSDAQAAALLCENNGTGAPINLKPKAAPSTLSNGDMWVETGTNTLKVRINGVTKTVTLT